MPLTQSFEELSQALRMLLEAHLRAHAQGLLFVDRREAVGNIETSYSAVLNAFHSLYDAMGKASQNDFPDWYSMPELSTLLVLRNARHHNHAKKVRTQYTYHAQEAEKPTRMASYVYVDFPAQEDGGDMFDLYVSWADLDALFNLPGKLTHLKSDTIKLVSDYIGSNKFALYAEHFDANERDVFFNVVPLIVNGAIVIVNALRDQITFESTEAKSFEKIFGDMKPARTDQPQIDAGPFILPE